MSKKQKGLLALYKEITGKTVYQVKPLRPDPKYQESRVKTIDRYGLDPL